MEQESPALSDAPHCNDIHKICEKVLGTQLDATLLAKIVATELSAPQTRLSSSTPSPRAIENCARQNFPTTESSLRLRTGQRASWRKRPKGRCGLRKRFPRRRRPESMSQENNWISGRVPKMDSILHGAMRRAPKGPSGLRRGIRFRSCARRIWKSSRTVLLC